MKKQRKDEETIYEFVVSAPALRVRESLENDVSPVRDVENHYSVPPHSLASNHPELYSSNLQSCEELLNESVYSRLCFCGQSTPSPVFFSSPVSTSSCSRNPSTSSCCGMAVLPTQDEEEAGDGTGGHTLLACKEECGEQTDYLTEHPAHNSKGHRIRSHITSL